VDYGVDLDKLQQLHQGVFTPSFDRYKEADMLKAKTLDEQANAVLATRKSPKSVEIIEKFIGSTSDSGYYLKNKVCYKGPGSIQVSEMFKRVLMDGHTSHRLPVRV